MNIVELFSPKASLGFCLGQGRVDVVRLLKSEAGIELVETVSKKIPANRFSMSELEEIISGIKEGSLSLRHTVVTNVDSNHARTLFFDLPFDRSSRNRSILPALADPVIMDDVDDFVFDYYPLTKEGNSGDPALLFGVEHEIVEEALKAIGQTDLRPDVILPDSLGLIAAGQDILQADDAHRVRLLIDIDNEQTVLALFEDGNPRLLRTIPFGLSGICHALTKDETLSFEEAEALMWETDLSGADLSGTDLIPPQDILLTAWQILFLEVRRTLAAYNPAQEEGSTGIILSGIGAKISGLNDLLAREFGLPVRLFQGKSEFEKLLPEHAKTAGLALIGLKSGFKPNLRQGDLAPRQALVRHKKSLYLVAVGLILTSLIAFSGLVLDYRYQRGRYLKVKSAIEKVYREAVPGSGKVVSPLLQLEQKVVSTKSSLAGQAASKRRALDLIIDVNRVIMKHSGLRLLDFSLSPQTLELQGEGGSYEDIDLIKNELADLNHFNEVTVGGARMDLVTKKLNFRLFLKRRVQ